MIFAIAFGLLAINHAISAILDISAEYRSWIYLLRLVAFSLIIWAIALKNAERNR